MNIVDDNSGRVRRAGPQKETWDRLGCWTS